jgi:hypothetical protein
MVALWCRFLLLWWWCDLPLLDFGLGGSGVACSSAAAAGATSRVEMGKNSQWGSSGCYIKGRGDLAHDMHHIDSEPRLTSI